MNDTKHTENKETLSRLDEDDKKDFIYILNTALDNIKELTPHINTLKALGRCNKLHKKFVGFASENNIYHTEYAKTICDQVVTVKRLVSDLFIISDTLPATRPYYLKYNHKVEEIIDKQQNYREPTLQQTLFQLNIRLNDFHDFLNNFME